MHILPTVALTIMLISFYVMLFVGFPVSFTMIFNSILYFVLTGRPLRMLPRTMFSGMNGITLLAIPLFILAANIMNRTGVTSRLMKVAEALVGHFKGGLAHANIVGSMLFAGCSGSALSDVAGLGSIEIPMMREAGYEPEFSSAVTAASSIQGPIIPPSVPMVIYGALTGVSIGALLLGGLLPGVLIGLTDMVIVYFLAKKRRYPVMHKGFSVSRLLASLKTGGLPLLTPVILIGGILTGICTPTEAAAIAVLYAVIMGAVYRTLSLRVFWASLRESVETCVTIFLMIGAASTFSWLIAMDRVPEVLANLMMNITHNRYVILVLINVMLLFWGMFMDTNPALFVLVPILAPILEGLGFHPVLAGVMLLVNLMVGLISPPYGMCLFIASAIGKVRLGPLAREIIPFFLVNVLVIALMICFPSLVLFLPRLAGLVR